MPENNTTEDKGDVAAVERWAQAYKDLTAEISKVIAGQQQVIEKSLQIRLCGTRLVAGRGRHNLFERCFAGLSFERLGIDSLQLLSILRAGLNFGDQIGRTQLP